MDWQDNEFEGFLKRFRLREAKPLPAAAETPIIPKPHVRQWRIAAAALLVVAVGASAAIVRQLSVKSPTESVVEKTPAPTPAPNVDPVAVESQTASTSSQPEERPAAPPAKLDPKPRDPLKQLTKVMPPQQDAGPQSPPAPAPNPPNKPFDDIVYVPVADTGTTSPGQQILNTACGNCHSIAVAVKSNFETPQEYVSLVNAMVGMGASVTTEQAAVLSDYLFKTYGRKADPEDRGKTVFTNACGQCHALEMMDNRKDGDRASYADLVNRMNDYGAGLNPAQIDPLLDYLVRTYGRKTPR
jgi:mono/diheme cytochrome c family protein